MWNRKNSVAIQSYSAKANKPEPEEKKRVSYLDFTVFPTDIRPRVEMMWSGISQRRLTPAREILKFAFKLIPFSHSLPKWIDILTKYSTVTLPGAESFPNCIVWYFNISNSKLRNISEAFYIPVYAKYRSRQWLSLVENTQDLKNSRAEQHLRSISCE